jgi:hypothetical protein
MQTLRTELIETQKVRSDLLKWKTLDRRSHRRRSTWFLWLQ